LERLWISVMRNGMSNCFLGRISRSVGFAYGVVRVSCFGHVVFDQNGSGVWWHVHLSYDAISFTANGPAFLFSEGPPDEWSCHADRLHGSFQFATSCRGSPLSIGLVLSGLHDGVGAHYLPLISLYGMWQFGLLAGGEIVSRTVSADYVCTGWVPAVVLLVFCVQWTECRASLERA
jgi:hypothetical protein